MRNYSNAMCVTKPLKLGKHFSHTRELTVVKNHLNVRYAVKCFLRVITLQDTELFIVVRRLLHVLCVTYPSKISQHFAHTRRATDAVNHSDVTCVVDTSLKVVFSKCTDLFTLAKLCSPTLLIVAALFERTNISFSTKLFCGNFSRKPLRYAGHSTVVKYGEVSPCRYLTVV